MPHNVCSRSEEPRMRDTLALIGNAPVLTVSDPPDAEAFCRRGGMVAFIVQDNRIRFALNTDAMTRAGLKSDSRLKTTGDHGRMRSGTITWDGSPTTRSVANSS